MAAEAIPLSLGSDLGSSLGAPAAWCGVCTLKPTISRLPTDRPASRDAVDKAARTAEQGSAGLPVGVQVVARHWREDLVLAGMRAIETEVSARPDHPDAPPL